MNKSKEYEELSIPEFCAGFAAILKEVESEEVKWRIEHLQDLMYSATQYSWKSVLNFHAACLLEIERGHIKWGDSFDKIESRTLAGAFLQSSNNRGSFGRSGQQLQQQQNYNQQQQYQRFGNNREEGGVYFCRFYQRGPGVCNFNQDHMGRVNEVERFVRHICAKCWLKDRKKEAHPESSNECPSFQQG